MCDHHQPDAHAHPDSDGDSETHADTHSNTDSDAKANTDSDANSNTNSDSDANSNPDAKANSDSDSDTNSNSDADTDTDADADTNPDADTNSDTNPDANATPDSNAYPNSDPACARGSWHSLPTDFAGQRQQARFGAVLPGLHVECDFAHLTQHTHQYHQRQLATNDVYSSFLCGRIKLQCGRYDHVPDRQPDGDVPGFGF